MSTLLETTEAYVTHLLTEDLDPRFLYHNLEHTQRVVQSTKELMDHYDLTGAEKKVLLLAAWLHERPETGRAAGTAVVPPAKVAASSES